jgi:hypothetical protein
VIFPGEEQKLRILQRNEEKLPDPADMIKSMEEEAKAIAQGMRNRAKADRAAGLDQISDETLLKNREDSERIHKLMVQVEELKRPQVKIAEEKPDPSWIEGLPDAQRKTVKSFDEWQGDRGFSLRKAGSNPEDDLHTSAQSNFTDYEVVPKVRSIPLDALGGLGGYDSPKELARIKNLAQQIEGNKEITPIFVGVDATGVPYVIEGQHRARAFKNLGMQSIPAKVIVDMTPEIGRAEGGLVTDTDAIAAKLKSTGMDDQKAFMQALRMADARQEAHMAGGGLLKALKGSKASTKAHPTVFPPAAPLTEAEMRPIAQRVAGQMTGEFVRPNPKLSVNPAGKAKKTFEREKTLPVEVTQRIEQKPAPHINYEEMKDAYLAGVPGDPTRGGVAKPGSLSEVHEGAEELRRLGDVEFEKTESGPVQLFGGPRYGAYSERDFWGSNLGPARAIQNTVDELGALGPVYGQYIKMSPESTNFALHNLDALLAYLQPEKLSKSKLEILNREIRKGSPKYGKFPGFSGFEDPIDVLLQSQLHSDLRKHIAETLMKPKLTSSLGLRQGSDVLFGISEPSLRNLETGISGYSVGKMEPGKDLMPSLHPTYDYDIPGSFLGQSRYPTPYEIAFPTSTAYTRANLKPGAQEFNTLKMIGAREKIDQQYIDQIKMYEELMKEYTGKKKGGLVKKSGLSVLNKAII